jgi:hypothetical protein
MSKRNKWWILYLRVYARHGIAEAKIIDKEFDSELDMLVWAGKNQIPKGQGWHFVVSPDGLTRLPNDLYERVDVLKREQVHQEALAEERALAKKEQKLRGFREARKQKRMGEVCNT